MATEDVLAEDGGVQSLGLLIVASETADAVGDGKTTINGTLQDAEDTVASGSAGNTNVEIGAERVGGTLLKQLGTKQLNNLLLNIVLLSGDVHLTRVQIGQLQLGQQLKSEFQITINLRGVRAASP